MSMTVADLIDQLSDLDPDMPLRVATQPSWPLAFEVSGFTTAADMHADSECEEHGDYNCEECGLDVADVAYIVTGEHPAEGPYAPRAAFEYA